MLDLSIVIIGYKTRGLLKNCLNSIFGDLPLTPSPFNKGEGLTNPTLNCKVVVVDNNSNDGTRELLEKDFPQVKALILDKNLGYAKAVNIGVRSLQAKYYFILNPDTLFLEKNIVGRLYQFMESHQEVGLAGPKLINPDGSVQPSCCKFPSFLIPLYRRTGLGKLPWAKKRVKEFLMLDWAHDQTKPVNWVIGTGMFVRDKAIENVGLMDERFFMYFEDTDWCRRFWQNGWKVYYVANIGVIHYHGRPSLKSGGLRDLFNKGTRIHIKSWLKYFIKYFFNLKTINTKPMDNQFTQPNFDFREVEPTNFLNQDKPKENSKTKKNKVSVWQIVVAIIIVLVLGIGLYTWAQASQLKNSALAGKEELKNAYISFLSADFSEGNTHLQASQKEFEKAEKAINNLCVLKILPWTKNNYLAGKILVASALNINDILVKIGSWGEETIQPITQETKTAIELTTKQKEAILKSLAESTPFLTEIKEDIVWTRDSLDEMPTEKVNSFILEIKVDLDDKLAFVEKTLDQGIALIPVAVQALGYPEEQTYLFLLQNNGELRPSGGFLGTYGVLKVKNAELLEFNTDNIQNLDNQAVTKVTQEAPEPIKKYTNASKWFLSDANWSPDFPTSAQKIEELYKLESNDTRDFNGVIAMDPMPIVDLLEITGPITIEEVTFDKDNFIDELEYYTYKGYAEEGVASQDRKKLIGKLGKEIMNYFFNSPLTEWVKAWNIAKDNLDQKHIMLALTEEGAQDFIAGQGWDSRVKATTGDYFMLADANMDSLKTDRVVNRDINYSVTENETGELLAKVQVTYEHFGKFTEKTTKLNSYARLYAPLNSELTQVTEVNNNNETDRSSDTVIEQDLDKNSFGIFISIEPGEIKTLTFEYKLPPKIAEQEEYTLLVQKQAGTIAYPLTVSLDFNKVITKFNPADLGNINENGVLTFSSDLLVDREFSVKF